MEKLEKEKLEREKEAALNAENERRKRAMEGEMERLKRELAKQKMAVIMSKADVIFSAGPGDIHELTWRVQN